MTKLSSWVPAWTFALIFVTSASLFAADQPNIIVILSDDMGYSDIGCYGSEIQTPTLDTLADNGLRFSQFYNTARCCPTRASLLSGLYPHQAGIGHMVTGNYDISKFPGFQMGLNQRCQTIAEVLKPAGYTTYMTGKWHVCNNIRPEGTKKNWPRQRGFDHFYGTITGAGSFYDPAALCRDNTLITPENDPEYQPELYYYTDAIGDNAVRFLKQHHEQSTDDNPFFLYVAFTAAHWPMHALPEDIAKYDGVYDNGFTEIRENRLAKLKQLGLIDASWEMSQQAGDWDKVKHKEWEIHNMKVYAAMIDRMDQNIAKITASLKESGDFDNTVIFFMQDNGGCAEGVGRGSDKNLPEARPAMASDELQLDIIPKFTRDGRPVRHGPETMPGAEDTYIAYGRDWANVSNTPFREYKHWVHEGGISTPLIVHWPKGIDAEQNGKLDHTPSHLIDIMATCVDVGKASYPEQVNGNNITPLPGVSLAAAFTGNEIQRKTPIFWEHEANCAVRDGKWKIVRYGKMGTGKTTPWELYDMEADRTEQHDLASQHPERVQKMANQWQAWAEASDVLPWPWGHLGKK
ncbi:arylsulfatase [Bremerella sp. P1]|uniref:arylsulfatase n=1 Tax=Bremerella sp. P1 TaxID=3026424 RepID=UPI0023684D27|nr:arylsulfatase [Bremerella sp. P1]WDI43908.1 arylsulfatase [Bremerella sp. P1]